MNELWEVAGRGLALLIILLFFMLIYMKVRKQTIGETWEEINNWVGKK